MSVETKEEIEKESLTMDDILKGIGVPDNRLLYISTNNVALGFDEFHRKRCRIYRPSTGRFIQTPIGFYPWAETTDPVYSSTTVGNWKNLIVPYEHGLFKIYMVDQDLAKKFMEIEVKLSSWNDHIPRVIQNYIKVNPRHPSFRLLLQRYIHMPLPDELETENHIVEWVEKHWNANGRRPNDEVPIPIATPQATPATTFPMTFDFNRTESGFCHFTAPSYGRAVLQITPEELVQAVERSGVRDCHQLYEFIQSHAMSRDLWSVLRPRMDLQLEECEHTEYEGERYSNRHVRPVNSASTRSGCLREFCRAHLPVHLLRQLGI